MRPTVRVALLGVLAASLVACGALTSDADRARRADAALASGDARGALIDYLKVAEADPDSVAAANGVILASLALNDRNRAQTELQRIKQRHPTDPTVLAAEVRLLAANGQWTQVIAIATPAATGTKTDKSVAPLVIEALLRTRRYDDADRMLDAALQESPGETVFVALRARSEFEKGRSSDALQRLARARRHSPDPELALLEAQMLGQLGRPAQAEQVLLATLQDTMPRARPARSALLASLVDQQLDAGRTEAAAASIEQLERLTGPTPATTLARARVLTATGNPTQALQILEDIAGKEPGLAQAACVQGQALAVARKPSDAESALTRCVASFPDDIEARRMLARVQSAASKNDAAARTLEPLRSRDPFDPDVLRLDLTVSGGSGPQQQRELIQKRFSESGKTAADRIGASRALLVAGFTPDANRLLSAKVDWQGFASQRARLAVVALPNSASLASVDAAVRDMVELAPDDPTTYLLAHGVLQRRGRVAEAQRVVEEGLQRAPFNAALLRENARIALAAGNLEAAEQYIRRGRLLEPRDPGFALLDYRRQLEAGDPAAALATLESSIGAVSPLPLRAELARARLSAGRVADARADLEALTRDGASADLTGHLEGEIELRQRRTKEAVAAFSRAVSAGAPGPEAMLRLGMAQLADGDRAAAERSIRAAVRLAPGYVDSTRVLVRLLLNAGRREPALEATKALAAVLPRSAAPLVLEAEITAHSGDAASSRRFMQAAYDLEPSPTIALQRFQLERRFDADLAEKRLVDDARKFPGDFRIALVLSEVRANRGDLVGATAVLQAAKDRSTGGRFPVLNNLAWLYLQTRDPRALEVARDAAALAPNNPDVLDTLGWVLYRNGQTSEALAKLRDAYARSQDNAEIALHLLAAERKSGEKARADALSHEWRSRRPDLVRRFDSAEAPE